MTMPDPSCFSYLYEFLGSEGSKRITEEEQCFWYTDVDDSFVYEVSDYIQPGGSSYRKVISREEAERDPDLIVNTIRLELTFLV